jgi:hypothetical protein
MIPLTASELIMQLQEEGEGHLSFEQLNDLRCELSYEEGQKFLGELEANDFAIYDPSNPLAARVSAPVAAEIGHPIALTDRCFTGCRFPPPTGSEEIRGFSTSSNSWGHLAGRAGNALIRNGVVVKIEVHLMN